MILLRDFNYSDRDFIGERLFPHMQRDEINSMIDEWNSQRYNNSYFEMFAVQCDTELTGFVSLLEQSNTEKVVSFGIEIVREQRHKGLAFQTYKLLLNHAAELGYKKVAVRVRTDNLPSIKLHLKSGFVICGEDVSVRGKNEYLFEKKL
jgi:RimJ/RimL family protein N-acetyltransferase